MKNKWGAPKKGKGEIVQKTYTFYPQDLKNLEDLRYIWKCKKTEVLRRLLSEGIEREKNKKV